MLYCKHNVLDEFGHRSDVARMYNVRHVPSFLYFYNGALVKREALPDSRTQALTLSQARLGQGLQVSLLAYM